MQGAAEDRAGRLDRATGHLRCAVALAPDFAAGHGNLADLLRRADRPDQAIDHFERAAALDPGQALWRHKLGAAYQQRGQIDRALEAFARGVRLDPADPTGRYNLGTLLYERRRLDEAGRALAATVALSPGQADGHFNRGVTAFNTGDFALAAACCERAIDLRPDYAEAWNTQGAAVKGLGDLRPALACFRRAIELNPNYHETNSNLLFFINYLPKYTDENHFRENRRWAQALERDCPAAPPLDNPADPNRRLRLGFVSPEFSREQNYMAFFEPVLAGHDRGAFEIYCYGDVAVPDSTTERVAGLAHGWRDIHGLDNDRRAQLIRADRIDILVNLCGWLPLHRALFARRMAPVQVAYINHVSTTGLANMDWRISDRWIDPPGLTEAWNTERLYRLETGYACYGPPPYAPEVDELPALRNGHVTFGSFNFLAKVTEDVVRLWADILRAVPASRLLIKAATLSDPAAQARYRSLFDRAGIDPGRLDMVGRVPDSADNLRVVQRADIALDPFPFNGGKSTCDVLWMGLPVIAYAGHSMIARVAASMVSRAGLPELVGDSPDTYRRIAVALARDLPRLAALRAGMRRRLAASALFDMAGHTRELEAAYRDMWRQWCTHRE
jgi:predicted O-linked N-acetylglucosamine transferase (SPINDLY family)